MKKRIVVLLSVVALLVVMLASSVAPAFARPSWTCVDPTRANDPVQTDSRDQKNLLESNGWVCTKDKKPHRE